MSGKFGPSADPLAPGGIAKKDRITWPGIIGGVLAAAVAWFGVQALTSRDPVPTFDAQVGDCLSLSGSAASAEWEKFPCSDGRANVVVTEVPSREEVGGKGIAAHCDPLEDLVFVKDDSPELPAGMCLRMNAKAGECWAFTGTSIPVRSACTADSELVVRIEGVHLDATDEAACSEAAAPALLEKRAILYCLEQVSVSPELEQQLVQSSAATDL